MSRTGTGNACALKHAISLSFLLRKRAPVILGMNTQFDMSFICGGWLRLPGEQYKFTVSNPKSKIRLAH